MVLTAILTTTVVPDLAADPSRTVSVEAVGMVLNNAAEPVESRQRSLLDAEKSAVEKAVGTLVRAHSLVDRSVLVESSISTRTLGRIRRYEITRQAVDGIWMKTTIRADVDLSDPGDEHPSLDSQLADIPAGRWAGLLAYTRGSVPTDEEIRTAQDGPMPVLRVFYRKIRGQAAWNIPDALLVEAVAKQVGIRMDRWTLDELRELITREDRRL